MPTALDAIVLADDPLARVRIAGLLARERAVRVAARAGATRTFVVGVDGARADLAAWRAGRAGPLLVVRADQLVHPPLVQPLVAAPVAAEDALAIAVGPDDAYAGALLATGAAAARVVEGLAAGAPDAALAAAATARVPHGAVARHPIATPAERAGAHRLLYGILIKPQDNAITRYVYRPVSFPLTRLLVWTPVTPNQISGLIAILVAIGCWLTMTPSATNALIGALIIQASSYLDCCDGEIARLKLLASRFGAWIDTVVDELSTIAYMAALGVHCHLVYGPTYLGDLGVDPWLTAVAIALPIFIVDMALVYYNLIVAVGSGNSQDYVARFVLAPGRAPGAVRLAPAPPAPASSVIPPWLRLIGLWISYLPRRDFLTWFTVGMLAIGQAHVMFGLIVTGGVVMLFVLAGDHVHLRRLRARARADGLLVERP